jgi:hypothetical protein
MEITNLELIFGVLYRKVSTKGRSTVYCKLWNLALDGWEKIYWFRKIYGFPDGKTIRLIFSHIRTGTKTMKI